MTLRIPAKVLIHVWSYDFYDMTLSTGKQQRHMIKIDICAMILFYFNHRFLSSYRRNDDLKNFKALRTACKMREVYFIPIGNMISWNKRFVLVN